MQAMELPDLQTLLQPPLRFPPPEQERNRRRTASASPLRRPPPVFDPELPPRAWRNSIQIRSLGFLQGLTPMRI
ncbi:unnamed protein product [Linum tenue]|uniref:Uncharacterized protein n=1 Tax=Linum tenue TaxID=586396 RepID=A0AAV0IRX7_9ROSI|nr:unnamed protein product [Linum tenue]